MAGFEAVIRTWNLQSMTLECKLKQLAMSVLRTILHEFYFFI